jgi:hypothetical protein
MRTHFALAQSDSRSISCYRPCTQQHDEHQFGHGLGAELGHSASTELDLAVPVELTVFTAMTTVVRASMYDMSECWPGVALILCEASRAHRTIRLHRHDDFWASDTLRVRWKRNRADEICLEQTWAAT